MGPGDGDAAGRGAQRGEEMAALEAVLHARRSDPRIAELLALAEPETEAEAAQLRLIAREHARTVKIPADLATELARVTSMAQGIWAQARADDDIEAFLPTLGPCRAPQARGGGGAGGGWRSL
jgi:carboxypeptidase Taq